MTRPHILCCRLATVFATLALLANSVPTLRAEDRIITPATVGEWDGDARIIVTWCRQKKLPLALTIQADGAVIGMIGNVTLTNGQLKRNRGWLGRKLNVKTDYIIVGALKGSIVAAEGITRSEVKIPLNFDGKSFTGGLHTNGRKLGGKKDLILSATALTLQRRARPTS